MATARAKARMVPPVGLENVNLNKEFGLALVRRKNDGHAELVSTIKAPQQVIDKAIYQIVLKDEKKK